MADTVSLREYLELAIEKDRELVSKELALLETARVLQHAEYSRRLTELNHAHEMNVARNNEFIRIDKFDSLEEKFNTYKESTQTALTLATGSKKGTASTLSIIIAAVGFILTLCFIVTSAITVYTFFQSMSNSKKVEQKIPYTNTQPAAVAPTPTSTPGGRR